MLFTVLQFGRFTTSQFTWVKKLPIEKKVNAVDAGGIISVLAFAAASILGFWLI
jgi:hypothetical protein